MYVCLCRAVTDQEIDAAIAAGCHTLREVGRQTQAASQCGVCAPWICQRLKETAKPKEEGCFHGLKVHVECVDV